VTADTTANAAQAHWEEIYSQKAPDQVSWYEPLPETSLALIEEAELPRDAAIIDVGGGTSGLAAQLIVAGYTDVTVVDISAAALRRASGELGSMSKQIEWIEADIRSVAFARRYDLWHDRAVFHFMVTAADRDRYLTVLDKTLRPGGHLILASFGPAGPTSCSGLPVARYGVDELLQAVGGKFALVSFQIQDHRTPGGRTQQFLYAHLRRVTQSTKQ
jgi:SAM-dependent methyltransferase